MVRDQDLVRVTQAKICHKLKANNTMMWLGASKG